MLLAERGLILLDAGPGERRHASFVGEGMARAPGSIAADEATAIWRQVTARNSEFGQALRFILLSGARIDEVLHLRADKVSLAEKKVELLAKGGKTRNIRVFDSTVLTELDLSRPFVYLPERQARQWKDRLERYVGKPMIRWTSSGAECMDSAQQPLANS